MSGGSARSDILARVRYASAGAPGESVRAAREALGRAPSAPSPAGNTLTDFIVNVMANHGTVACAADRTGTVKAVAAYLYDHFKSQRLVAGSDARLAALPWRDGGVLPRFGALEEGEKVALSYARVGVAETGAIVTFTGKATPAANNLLAEHHIVLLDCDDVVDTLEDAWDRVNPALDKEGRPRGLNFIAGPSSTADIEGRLVYGAHGPRAWHVIVIGERAEQALQQAQQLRPQ